MADSYGLTSLNKVIFLMSVCDDTQVSLAEFSEPDVARMRTIRDVITALSRFAETAGAGGSGGSPPGKQGGGSLPRDSRNAGSA